MAEIYAGKTEIIKRADFGSFSFFNYNQSNYDKIVSQVKIYSEKESTQCANSNK